MAREKHHWCSEDVWHCAPVLVKNDELSKSKLRGAAAAKMHAGRLSRDRASAPAACHSAALPSRPVLCGGWVNPVRIPLLKAMVGHVTAVAHTKASSPNRDGAHVHRQKA